MREIGILEARTRFSALIDDVESGGEEVAITRRGKVVARLLGPMPQQRSRAEIADSLDALRERIAAKYGSDPTFDIKAAIEEGRE